MLEWNLTANGREDQYSAAYTPLGRVYLRAASGYLSGPDATSYPTSTANIYNNDGMVGYSTRFVDPDTPSGSEGGVSTPWTKSNTYSDWTPSNLTP